MEINQRKIVITDEIQYKKASKKARELRDFYINLSLFCFLIPIIIGVNLYFVPEFHWFWFSIMGWGTGLTIQGLMVFGLHTLMKSDWEERKMKQFLKEEIEREEAANNYKKQ